VRGVVTCARCCWQGYGDGWAQFLLVDVAEKLLLLLITFFFPRTTAVWVPLTVATVAIGILFVTTTLAHVLTDSLEYGIDLTAR
jgi:hypothetical protein